MSDLLNAGDELFRRRRGDGFFRGGDQTEGGGNDNEFTVDYRLAALAKHVGDTRTGPNRWLW